MKFFTSHQGFTLVELMIAVSLFTIVMMLSTTMFLRSIDVQARSVKTKSLQEGLNYALLQMTNEATGALQNPTTCNGHCPSATDFFCSLSSGTVLIFRNAAAECVRYEISGSGDGYDGRLKVTRAGNAYYLTPAEVFMTSFKVNVGNTDDVTYPIGEVTLSIAGQNVGSDPFSLQMQTTVATWPPQ